MIKDNKIKKFMPRQRQITITAEYFRQYRQKLGFSNQTDVKNFFGAKDIAPTVDLKNIETFKRTPKADLEIRLKGKEKIRIEMQSGFAGINDIKQHKVLEAKKVFRDLGFHTLAIHFDLYNGQVAFIKLDEIEDDGVNWITRQQMEGQTVFNIDQNYFIWKITDRPMKYKEINFD